MKSGVCAAICFLFASIAMASSPIFSNLIVFGDSLSDAASLSLEPNMAKEKEIGNNYWVKADGKTGAPITSVNFSSKESSLWPNDLMADPALFQANPNATRYIYPSRQASQKGYSPWRYSIDYAWASAETGDNYLNDFDLNEKTFPPFIFPSYDTSRCESFGSGQISINRSCVPGVILQVKQYLKDVNQHPNPRSLIIIWAGGNDIFNNAAKIGDKNKDENKLVFLLKMLNTAYPLGKNMGVAPLSNPIDNIKQAVALLIQSGVPVKNIYVVSMPDLDKTPAAQAMAHNQKAVLYLWAFISKIFNVLLEINLVFDYRHPELTLPRHNIILSSNILTTLLQNQQAYDFSMGYQNCVSKQATPYCQGYIFFNGKHVTTEVHQRIAEYFKEVLSVRLPKG